MLLQHTQSDDPMHLLAHGLYEKPLKGDKKHLDLESNWINNPRQMSEQFYILAQSVV